MNSPIRPWAADPVHWMTGTAASAFDRRAIQEMGVPQPVLMERAGVAAAQLVEHLYPRGPVGVMAGKGNNGGDALVAARALLAWGRDVRVVVGDRGESDPLLHGWPVPLVRADTLDAARLEHALDPVPLWLDGILGTGIRGAPRGGAARLIRALRACPSSIVALDVPSGVDADTGAAEGDAVRADVTVAFGFPKLGTLLHPGRGLAGRLVVAEIGFPPPRPGDCGGVLLTPGWARGRWPRREAVTHKNRVGSVAVIAGRPGMAGAGVLAARTALRAGAGYVRLVTDPANRVVVQSALPEAVFVDASDSEAVRDAVEASTAVAVGPGMGTDARAGELLATVADILRPRVLDADALTLLAGSEVLAALGRDAVLTPHPGEAARLLGTSVEEVQADRPGAAARLRERTGACAVVLKGAPTLVRTDDGLWVDTVGSSDLAVAGMGDTLTGAVGAFLAQGCAGPEAAGLGLVATGRAAALARRGAGLQAADVPEFVPDAVAEGPAEARIPIPGLVLDLDPAR